MTYRLPRLDRALTLCSLWLAFLPVSALAVDAKDLEQLTKQAAAAKIPVNQLADPLRAKVAMVLQKAQIFERGKTESFPCNQEIYRWLLESPDASLFAWKRLGATKASITRQPNGTFLGSDGSGGEVRWQLIASDHRTRIWYAEGSGRMGPLLPTMSIRALVLLTFQNVQGPDGRSGIQHRLELFAHYDSTPLITKLTGLSAESIGKKAVQQMEVFFSGMAWYASEHAQWSKSTFSQWATTSENKARLDPFLQLVEAQNATNLEPLPLKSSRTIVHPK